MLGPGFGGSCHPRVVRVKICGVTRPGDADLAARLGAWAIGVVVLFPDSARSVDMARARSIVGAVARRAETVAVMVQPTPREAAEVVAEAGFSMVQLHGGDVAAVREAAGVPVIRAVAGEASRGRRPPTAAAEGDLLLVDGGRPGSGEPWPWARGLDVPRAESTPLVVAGGLEPANVREALRALDRRAFALDVSTGVEASPGVKDPARVAAFLREAGVVAA
jgi:phosphoribosylanthranilate isomerase